MDEDRLSTPSDDMRVEPHSFRDRSPVMTARLSCCKSFGGTEVPYLRNLKLDAEVRMIILLLFLVSLGSYAAAWSGGLRKRQDWPDLTGTAH